MLDNYIIVGIDMQEKFNKNGTQNEPSAKAIVGDAVPCVPWLNLSIELRGCVHPAGEVAPNARGRPGRSPLQSAHPPHNDKICGINIIEYPCTCCTWVFYLLGGDKK